MYEVIYKDVILFKSNTKQEALNTILDYAAKNELTFDTKVKIFGRIELTFYDANNNYYTYTIIKE